MTTKPKHPPKALFDAMKRLCDDPQGPFAELCKLYWIPEAHFDPTNPLLVEIKPGTPERFAVELGVGKHLDEPGAVEIHRLPAHAQGPGELVGWVTKLWEGLPD